MSAISERLAAFTAEAAWERGSILAFMQRIAAEIPPGSSILDVGAGEAPYRELFAHADYRTSDWTNSVHPGARRVDVVGSAESLPVADASYDAVIMTQVLEHVPRPWLVLEEMARIVRPGGSLYLTLPLVWELHEQPWDFYRYTPHGLRTLLGDAGFIAVDVAPRNDCFTTIGQLMRNAGGVMGRADDGRNPQRDVAALTMRGLADVVAAYAPLDAQGILPLGYAVSARRPDADDLAAIRRSLGLGDARATVILADAGAVLAHPELLAAHRAAVSGDDDVTLAIHVDDLEDGDLLERLNAAASAAGLDGEGAPDVCVVALPAEPADQQLLALVAAAALSASRPRPPFHALPLRGA